jgi:hypothetical protein
MPIIAARPSFGDYDHTREPTAGLWHSLVLRIKVSMRGDALLRERAAGAPPGLSPELALRASKLVNDRHRHHLAGALRRATRDAHRPPMTRSSLSIVDRRAVVEAEVDMDAVIELLSSRRPVAVQGMAMVERLITDGVASPLYNDARPGTLRRQPLAATSALELESGGGEFSLAA